MRIQSPPGAHGAVLSPSLSESTERVRVSFRLLQVPFSLLLTLTLSILGLCFPLGRHCNTRVLSIAILSKSSVHESVPHIDFSFEDPNASQVKTCNSLRVRNGI